MAAIPAVGLLAGSAVGLLLPDLPPEPSWALLATSVASACYAWRFTRPREMAAWVGLAFCAGGSLLASDAWQQAWRPPLRVAFERLAAEQRAEAAAEGRVVPEDDTVIAAITGVLRADASRRENGVSLSVAVNHIDDAVTEGGVLLTVAGDLAGERVGEWRAGRTVRAPVALRRPSRYLDRGVPDEERAMARRGTTLVGSIKSGALVDVVAHGSRAAEVAAAGRAFVRRAVASAVGPWSGQSAGIVTAILIGDRAGLDDDLTRRLQEAGTYHVIAISGGNIALLAGLLLAVFRAAGLLGRSAMLAAIGVLLAYCHLVGGGASVTRATFMAAGFFAARAIDLRGPPSNALALAAAALVAAQPLAAFDPAFLLTFGATGAILAAAPVVAAARLPRLLAPIAGVLAASAAAETLLMPIGAVLFSRITFAGLVLNFAAIPLMGLAQIAGMAAVALSPISRWLASWAGWAAHLGAAGLVRSAGFVDVVPALTWRVAHPGWIPLAIYYTGAIAAWLLWRQGTAAPGGSRRVVHARRVTTTVTMAAALWILAEPWTLLAGRGRGLLRVTFIDVGQGDAALVRFPTGESWLIDAGGLPSGSSFDIGDRVVAPVLRELGVRRLDLVAVTHGDADHMGGAPSIVGEFRPRDLWEGIPVPRSAPLQALQAVAMRNGSRRVNVQANDALSIGEVRVVVRHPPIADWERQDVRNDDSIVLELLWRDVSVVLTGDVGREVERAIAGTFAPARLRVVKVPHHGSLTSSSPEFVRALAPAVAVVSVGRSNAFGHPAPAVLDRYRAAGAEIFRTDRDGAVTVETDGTSLIVRTFTGRQIRLHSPTTLHHEDTKDHEDTKKTST